MAFFSPSIRPTTRPRGFRPSHIAQAVAASIALASVSGLSAQTVPEITITDAAPSQVSGFGDVPLRKAPFSAVTIDSQTLQDIGAQRVSDALRLDPSVADSYNSPAYWDMLSVRGYTLDNRYNYRREGLPITAETMISMDNKDRIELFKGTSGIQAGTSAPGGLVNYVVKRPPTAKDDTIRSVSASHGPGNSSSVALDLGGRFGNNQDVGYRVNATYEDLNPYIRNTPGHRHLIALAMDWRMSADSRLEWEFEQSERQQMGINGYSLLGNALPAPVDGQTNLTRQSWSVPGVFAGTTGSVRFKQNLGDGWLWTTSYGAQRLRTDDRLTFAFGATLPNGDWLGDRFAPNGSFDLYDYRSNNERRTSDALQTEVTGQTRMAGLQHDVGVSIMRSRLLDRLSDKQAYNWAGTGHVDGTSDSPTAQPTPGDLNTDRSEYTTELALRDRIEINAQTALWLGLRHSQMNRASVRTDGSRAAQDVRSFNTPWLAASYQITPAYGVYASYGEGVETEVAPNRSKYTNAGQALPALRSQQVEIGVKGQWTQARWQATVFDITRPQTGDAGTCNADNTCTRQTDGQAHHRGLELAAGLTQGAWTLDAGAAWIDAMRQNAVIDPTVNGQRALNVPRMTLRAQAQYRFADVPGLRTSLRLSHEAERLTAVLDDGRSLNLPAWTTLDLATHYDTHISGTRTQWTLAVDNLTDRHYWRESPKEFGHYYLYPGAPRTLRLAVKASF
ncbi:MAG: TonB-dependent siderophore receptor [Limnohabitans sp.]|nr:TonB-dependent siderophore receptor [Limnohabitans sp.]